MKIEGFRITAAEGYVFRRISDQAIFGKEVELGITYFIGGEKLDAPFHEMPEHYEEVIEEEEVLPVDSDNLKAGIKKIV